MSVGPSVNSCELHKRHPIENKMCHSSQCRRHDIEPFHFEKERCVFVLARPAFVSCTIKTQTPLRWNHNSTTLQNQWFLRWEDDVCLQHEILRLQKQKYKSKTHKSNLTRSHTLTELPWWMRGACVHSCPDVTEFLCRGGSNPMKQSSEKDRPKPSHTAKNIVRVMHADYFKTHTANSASCCVCFRVGVNNDLFVGKTSTTRTITKHSCVKAEGLSLYVSFYIYHETVIPSIHDSACVWSQVRKEKQTMVFFPIGEKQINGKKRETTAQDLWMPARHLGHNDIFHWCVHERPRIYSVEKGISVQRHLCLPLLLLKNQWIVHRSLHNTEEKVEHKTPTAKTISVDAAGIISASGDKTTYFHPCRYHASLGCHSSDLLV